jgi:GntR family transcriptional regulator
MLPFAIALKAGLPITEQVIFAVKKAVVAGRLKPGTPFPSVRVLSQELVAEGVLVTTPAVGSVVAGPAGADPRARAALLEDELERLVVEAKNLGLGLDEVQAELAAHWKRLGKK